MKAILIFFLVGITGLSIHLYQQKPLEQSLVDGEEIYVDFCLQCHMDKGQGISGSFPPLAKSDYLKNIDQSIHAVKYGLKGPIQVNGKTYNSNMISQGLDDQEIADVMNYILRSWGNQTEIIITEEKVASIQK